MENSNISPLFVPTLEKRLFYFTIMILFITGVVFLYLDLKGGLTPTLRDIKSITLHIHGWFSPIIIFLFGSFISTHVKNAWVYKKNFLSGLSIIILLSLLTITAPALYYISDELLRAISWWIHILAGIILPACIYLHIRKIIKRN